MMLSGKPIHLAVATSAGLGVPIAVIGAIGFLLAGLRHQVDMPPFSIGYVSVIGFAVMAPVSSYVAGPRRAAGAEDAAAAAGDHARAVHGDDRRAVRDCVAVTAALLCPLLRAIADGVIAANGSESGKVRCICQSRTRRGTPREPLALQRVEVEVVGRVAASESTDSARREAPGRQHRSSFEPVARMQHIYIKYANRHQKISK
jgi:hypothetical protein